MPLSLIDGVTLSPFQPCDLDALLGNHLPHRRNLTQQIVAHQRLQGGGGQPINIAGR